MTWGKGGESSSPLPNQLVQQHLLKRFSVLSSNCFGTLVNSHLPYLWEYLWPLSCVFWSTCLCYHCHTTLIIYLYSKFWNKSKSSKVAIFFQDYLVTLVPFPCNIDFRISLILKKIRDFFLSKQTKKLLLQSYWVFVEFLCQFGEN